MGPSAIRYAGLQERIESLGRACVDHGDVRAAVAEATDGRRSAGALPRLDHGLVRTRRRRSSRTRARAATCRSCSAATTRSRSARSAGWRACDGPGGVLWIDAHGDLNRPETSPSGNVHGMPLAAALGAAGAGVRERRVADAVASRAPRSSACARSTRASAT